MNMTRTITELGSREAEFLATFSASGREIFTTEQAAGFWGDAQRTRNEISHLEAKGWIQRLERGRYLIIPLEAGPEREWSEDPIAIGTYLVLDGGAAYWTAVRHWGWTTQLPREYLFITGRRRFRPRTRILGVSYRFVTVKPGRVFGIAEEWNRGLALRVTDRERTVIDMLDRPDLAGGIAEVATALSSAWPEIRLDRVTEYANRHGSGTIFKRLGFLVEALDLPGAEDWLDAWRASMGSGITRLERGSAAGGRILRRWNLQVNAGGFDEERAKA